MRALLLVALGLMLGGCYESQQMLLNPASARQPIAKPMDWKYTNKLGTFHGHLTPRPDGWYDYDEKQVNSDGSEDNPWHRSALLNRLDRVDNADVYIIGFREDREDAYMYGLVVMRPDINWRIVMPNCDRFTAQGEWYNSDLTAAKLASGRGHKRGRGCNFLTIASLRRAMNNVVHSPDFWTRVKEQ